MSDLDKVVSLARDWRRRGYYQKAIDCLRGSSQVDVKNDLVVLQIGDNLLLQGCYRDALELIESHLAAIDYGNPDTSRARSVLCSLRMLRCILVCYVLGKFHANIAEATRIWEVEGGPNIEVEVERPWVMVAMYYCRLLHLAGGIAQIERYRGQVDPIRPILQKLFLAFEAVGDIDTCFEIAICCFHIFGIEERRLLDTLLSARTISSLQQARIRAFLCMNISIPETQELYSLSLPILQEFHNHESHDLEIHWLRQSVLQGNDDSATNISRLLYLVNSYESLRYPAGLLQSYLKLLDVARSLYMLELQVQLLKECRLLADRTGSLLFLVMLEAQTLGQWQVHGLLNSLVYQASHDLYAKMIDHESEYQKGLVAYFAAGASLRQGYTLEALNWSNKCIASWASCSKDSRALAHLQWLASKIGILKDAVLLEDLREFVQSGEETIDGILLDEEYDHALKGVIMMTGALIPHPAIEESLKREWIERLIRKTDMILQQGKQALSPVARTVLLDILATYALHKGSFLPSISFEEEAMSFQEEAISIYTQHEPRKHFVQLATCRQNSGIACYQAAKKLGTRRSMLAASKALNTCLRIFFATQEAYDAVGSLNNFTDIWFWIASVRSTQYNLGLCHAAVALDSFRCYYKVMEERRSEAAILKGITGMRDRRRLSSDRHVRQIGPLALQVCLKTGMISELWDWVQRTKARSLSDALSLDTVVPRRMLDEIQDDETTHGLYEQETRLAAALNIAAPLDRLAARQALNKHRETMRANRVLNELLSLRDGDPIQIMQLREALEQDELRLPKGRDIVFIDWFLIQDEVFTISFRRDRDRSSAIQCFKVTANAQYLKVWVDNNLRQPDCREQVLNYQVRGLDRPLVVLDPLVEYVAEQSKSGDVLVFCPSDWIHAVPLHALHLAGDEYPLIKRNPIVYSASVTTFVQACRRMSPSSSSGLDRAAFMAAYEPLHTDTSGFDDGEREKLYRTTKEFGDLYGGSAVTGRQATVLTFSDNLKRARLVHFHGHCDMLSSIVDQHLKLFDGNVTVNQLLDMNLSAQHVSLLACGSSVQDIAIGDEPLGLVTAFLCAGASSVLGTMWRVESKTARRFSKLFYPRAFDPADSGIIDLAVAVQQAAIGMSQRSATSRPIHWASFVLHGSWFT